MTSAPVYLHRLLLPALLICPLAGCFALADTTQRAELVWGQQGRADGRFDRPRALTIGKDDSVYVVDKTGRIQVFDGDGHFLRGWRTPESTMGQPCGLGIDGDGNLLVADTHYFRMLIYTPAGELLAGRSLGGYQGSRPGQFNFVTDAVQDSAGNYYVSEYGQFDRVQKFSREGEFLLQWGSHGSEPGQFIQPRCLVIDERDHVWVSDACNHRIQVFDARGAKAELIRVWGREGTAPGELRYPYGLTLDNQGHIYVTEYGNSRVQQFTLDGQFVAAWGRPGRGEGELNQPWAIGRDSKGRLFVADTYNHRIHRIRLD